MQIYFWFYVVSAHVTPFGTSVVSSLWLSGSSLDEVLLLSGHVSEVWLAAVCLSNADSWTHTAARQTILSSWKPISQLGYCNNINHFIA